MCSEIIDTLARVRARAHTHTHTHTHRCDALVERWLVPVVYGFGEGVTCRLGSLTVCACACVHVRVMVWLM